MRSDFSLKKYVDESRNTYVRTVCGSLLTISVTRYNFG